MPKVSDFDRFGIENMSKEEYEERQQYVLKNCLCPSCPTYVEGDYPYGYCFPPIGTSRKIMHEKECICETCPIYREYELNHTFYCTRCSQLCQTYKQEVAAGHE
ncbi:MAG TPA: DUF2769 domain-containing protein [Deltaproteobacteria bacterium]|nr:DUF2769 domain-containing protein [Deltaproteobacteria bacterium]